ncbi:hypothetical protein K443DRAFT_82216 [Laccaria amethystina LaAM-08-1]|uniref:Uncharacterized protein n=1 Tax=Laccaria amethystina LaAM-08-1 TaxID=1095629 RepID=A0A0C9Y6Q6_9AGAR|nr:hypothetical protein K443DRAFT_82216 [Laccaria amethystina LaAM-08-1]
MKTTPNNTFRKLRKGATTFILWEKSSKKEGAYPKRDIITNRLQRITVMILAYVIHWNKVFIKLLGEILSILVHSDATSIPTGAIPVDSSGMPPFLQESVGHDEVLT